MKCTELRRWREGKKLPGAATCLPPCVGENLCGSPFCHLHTFTLTEQDRISAIAFAFAMYASYQQQQQQPPSFPPAGSPAPLSPGYGHAHHQQQQQYPYGQQQQQPQPPHTPQYPPAPPYGAGPPQPPPGYAAQQSQQQPPAQQRPWNLSDPTVFQGYFAHELRSLTFNSKPIINSLTMLAHEFSNLGHVVAQCLEDHIRQVREGALIGTHTPA